jgi:hypothetical protein
MDHSLLFSLEKAANAGKPCHSLHFPVAGPNVP